MCLNVNSVLVPRKQDIELPNAHVNAEKLSHFQPWNGQVESEMPIPLDAKGTPNPNLVNGKPSCQSFEQHNSISSLSYSLKAK